MVLDRLKGVWIECTKCRGAINSAKSLTAEVIAEQADSEFTAEYDKLKIPQNYRKVYYSAYVLEVQASSYFAEDVKRTLEILDKIKFAIENGFLPAYSVYIHAPNEVDIAIWVYAILKTAVKKRMTAVPYLSVKELGYISNKDKDLFFEYANAQVCILDLSAKFDWETASTLADILGIRSKKGLPTIVTGYWSYKVITKKDSHGLTFLLTEDKERLGLLKCYNLNHKGRYNQPETVTSAALPEKTFSDEEVDSFKELTD